MNLAIQGGDSSCGVRFISFNQDVTSIAVGTKEGFKIYSLSSVDKLEPIYESVTEEMVIVERLFSSSLIAVVTAAHPRKLKVCHFKKGTEICNYSFSNNILSVRLNRARLVVCLEESLYIHNIRDMKVLHTIRETPRNPTGLCALSINSDNSFLAYPGNINLGEVQVFDALHLQARTVIMAHDSPVAALSFNAAGTQLATASERGTVIRVWHVVSGDKLYEFRRGVKRCASIFTLTFSSDGTLLAVSSNTETVHIFRLDDTREPVGAAAGEEGSGWVSYISRAVTASASYLPSQVTEVFTQGRAFATTTLQFQGIRNCCALAVIQKSCRLLVASSEGYLYIYNVDLNEGGNCRLVKQHRLDGVEVAAAEGAAAAAGPGEQAEARPVCEGSYANVVKGSANGPMTESERCRELSRASESPPRSDLKLDDSSEFPPMTHRTE